jgi:hypothetical protein
MNEETPDPLETELARLRPQPVSPRLPRQIAERLNSPRRWLGLSLAAAVAAGLIVVLAWPKPEPPAPRHEIKDLAVNGTSKLSSPTLAEYRRAIDRSPTALDQLLNQRQTFSLYAPREELRAGRRLDQPFLDSLGEP